MIRCMRCDKVLISAHPKTGRRIVVSGVEVTKDKNAATRVRCPCGLSVVLLKGSQT